MNLTAFEQMVVLSSILSGFAFSAATQLMSIEERRRIVSLTILTLLVSASASLVSTLVFSMSIFVSGALAAAPKWQVGTIGLGGFFALLLGLFLFMLGAGLMGWIRSKRLGIATTLVAAVGGTVMLWAVFGIVTIGR